MYMVYMHVCVSRLFLCVCVCVCMCLSCVSAVSSSLRDYIGLACLSWNTCVVCVRFS